jgi:hypothetical protein
MRDQGQGHIRQRGPQRWELKFDLGRDPKGKRLSRYVNFNGTKREAQAELTRLLSRKAEGLTSIRRRCPSASILSIGSPLTSNGE